MNRNIVTGRLLLLLLAGLVPFATSQTWTSNGPLSRYGHSAIFDPSTEQMIIYGGYSPSNPTFYLDGDVWRLLPSASLSGVQNWVAVHPTGTPPEARYGHLAGYDPQNNRMVVFAGYTGSPPCGNDVWVLTSVNGKGGSPAWSGLNPAGNPPSPRGFAAGAYDPASNSLMVYGGDGCGTALGDYWVLSNANGLGGTPTWTEFFPPGGPGPRFGHTAVYDPTSNELIVFAGYNGLTWFNDVWVLKNANGVGGVPLWQQLSATGVPLQRAYSSATYDPASNVMTIFGGIAYGDGGEPLNDVFVLSDANNTGGPPAWTQIAQASVDYATWRGKHTAVYDASKNTMMVFGGQVALVYYGGADVATNDLFFLSHANGK